jgi:hypothetical protein
VVLTDAFRGFLKAKGMTMSLVGKRVDTHRISSLETVLYMEKQYESSNRE